MEYKKLADVCVLNRFQELDAATLSELNVGYGNIKLLPSSKDYDWFSTEDICKNYICEGEVITLGRARYANIKYWSGKFVAANNVVIETFNPEKLVCKYLYYFLLFNVKRFYVEGTTYPKFDNNIFKSTYIPIPSLEKQRQIVNQLDFLCSSISKVDEEINNLSEIVKSRFIEMFMDGKNDKYPLSNWENVITIKHGKDYKKNLVEIGGYPVYGSGGFMGIYTDKYLVNENATIIGRKGTIDKPLFVKEKFWNVDTAFGIEVDKKKLNPVFFYIRSTLYDLKSFSTSTTLPSMTKERLQKIKIGVPPIELQDEFAKYVSLVDKSKFNGRRNALCY